MFLLLLKVEGPGVTSVNFVGMYPSRDEAEQNVDPNFGPLQESGFGNQRMLQARGGLPLKSILATKAMEGASYVLAEFGEAELAAPFIPTHEITTDGQRLLVVNDDGAFFTEEEWGADGEHAWGLDDCNDLVLDGCTPPSGSAYRELSPLEPHFVVDGEPNDGAFTVGQFLLANLDAAPPVHEILVMMLLKVGHRISFGCGAQATTTIRRVR